MHLKGTVNFSRSCLVSELLLSKKQKGLAAQALQELGNIYYHANDIRLKVNSPLLTVIEHSYKVLLLDLEVFCI